MTGLTSISFRKETPGSLIRLAKQAGLACIEWGSDVHVPPGDPGLAEHIAAMMRDAGLTVSSYGSYLKVGEAEETMPAFQKLLVSAQALGAPVIRVWAGPGSPDQVSAAARKQMEDRLKRIVDLADRHGIRVATEYHRGTLTERGDSARALLDSVEGLYTYWQPNPDISEEANLHELEAIRDRVLNVHVFHWTAPGDVRHPLVQGETAWRRYIRLVQEARDLPHHFLLEFVKDDRPEQCIEDAAVLNRLLRGNTHESDLGL